MSNSNEDDERDNNTSTRSNKRLKLDESVNNSSSISNNNNSTVTVEVDNDDNERLFRLVWNNIFLRNKILYYLKSTWRSVLLPKYNNSNEINNKYEFRQASMEGYKKSYGFNYDQINKVRKMVDRGEHVWLLKSKVSRGDPLNFSLKKYDINSNDFIQIYRAIRDDIQFYQKLFKNYSKYLECKWNDSNSSNSNKEVNYIIRCDCWAALQVLVEDLKLVEVSIKHYLYAINNGSIKCAKYLLKKFNFKLNKYQIDKLLNTILKINENKEEDEEDKEDGNNERCLEISKEQIKEFGFCFKKEDYQIAKKNQTLLFLKSRIDQDLSDDEKPFKLFSSTTPYFMNYEINDKRLKFIIESCEAISFIVSLLQPSSTSSFWFKWWNLSHA